VSRVALSNRDLEHEPRATTGSIVDVDTTPVQSNVLLDERQPET
jgi:hypothetical protein